MSSLDARGCGVEVGLRWIGVVGVIALAAIGAASVGTEQCHLSPATTGHAKPSPVYPCSMPLLLLAASLLLAGCHAFYNVRGAITNCRSGAPVAGAVVDLSYPGERGKNTSNDDGTFQVAVNDPPNTREGTLKVTAPGYTDLTRSVHDGDRLTLCLDEAAKPSALEFRVEETRRDRDACRAGLGLNHRCQRERP